MHEKTQIATSRLTGSSSTDAVCMFLPSQETCRSCLVHIFRPLNIFHPNPLRASRDPQPFTDNRPNREQWRCLFWFSTFYRPSHRVCCWCSTIKVHQEIMWSNQINLLFNIYSTADLGNVPSDMSGKTFISIKSFFFAFEISNYFTALLTKSLRFVFTQSIHLFIYLLTFPLHLINHCIHF